MLQTLSHTLYQLTWSELKHIHLKSKLIFHLTTSQMEVFLSLRRSQLWYPVLISGFTSSQVWLILSTHKEFPSQLIARTHPGLGHTLTHSVSILIQALYLMLLMESLGKLMLLTHPFRYNLISYLCRLHSSSF
jgi:hypothetical protein